MTNDYTPGKSLQKVAPEKKIGKVLTLKNKGGQTAEINENNTEALKLAKDSGYTIQQESISTNTKGKAKSKPKGLNNKKK